MKIITTNTVVLYPINIPFELYIKWKTRRGAEGNGWWFTPSGKGRIGMDHVSWEEVGQLDNDQDKQVTDMMIKYKTNFLTDGSDVYTRMSPGLVRVRDTQFLRRMQNSWVAQWRSQLWEAKKEYDETIDNLKPIKQ